MRTHDELGGPHGGQPHPWLIKRSTRLIDDVIQPNTDARTARRGAAPYAAGSLAIGRGHARAVVGLVVSEEKPADTTNDGSRDSRRIKRGLARRANAFKGPAAWAGRTRVGDDYDQSRCFPARCSVIQLWLTFPKSNCDLLRDRTRANAKLPPTIITNNVRSQSVMWRELTR
jgi:hypothetical protein